MVNYQCLSLTYRKYGLVSGETTKQLLRLVETAICLALTLWIGLGGNAYSARQPMVPVSFTFVVDPALQATPMFVEGNRPVGVAVNAYGVREEYILDEVLFRPKNRQELEDFLRKYHGQVLRDDSLPIPPPQIAAHRLRTLQTKPSFVIRVDLNRADLYRFEERAQRLGARGRFRFSSEAAARLVAIVAEETLADRRLGINLVLFAQQMSDEFTSSQEGEQAADDDSIRPHTDGSFGPRTDYDGVCEPGERCLNAFHLPEINDPNIRVDKAWQYLRQLDVLDANFAANRRVALAIIDNGFAGPSQYGADFDNLDFGYATSPLDDFIAFDAIPQWDPASLIASDSDVSGPNAALCLGGKPCPWHGTQVWSTAGGVLNNSFGSAGTAGNTATPMFFRWNGTWDAIEVSIYTAVAWGADIINLSMGGFCSTFCTWYLSYTGEGVVSDAIEEAQRQHVTVIAAAGNEHTNLDLMENDLVAYDPHYIPCEMDGVLCVGSLTAGMDGKYDTAWRHSNYGSGVDIWAPGVNLTTTPVPPNPRRMASFSGTSAASPYVAGIVAMLLAVNPSLTPAEVQGILEETGAAFASPGDNTGILINAYEAVVAAATMDKTYAEGCIARGDCHLRSDSQLRNF
jgi:hypothetical protein